MYGAHHLDNYGYHQYSSYKICVACEGDAESIYDVHTSSIRELCRTHYNEEDIREWINQTNLGK